MPLLGIHLPPTKCLCRKCKICRARLLAAKKTQASRKTRPSRIQMEYSSRYDKSGSDPIPSYIS